MTKTRTLVIGSLASIAILVVALVLLLTTGGGGPSYPAFPLKQLPIGQSALTPQTKIDQGRDFGIRTGDTIVVYVYVDQMPDTQLDPESFSVTDTNNGDIEFSSAVLGSEQLPNGTTVYAIAVTLRKWSYDASFSIDATMTYLVNSTDDTETLALPKMTFYMSPTWDGVKQLQDGPKPVYHDDHLVANGILLGLGVLGLFGSVFYIRRRRRKNTLALNALPKPLTAVESARLRFDETWELIDGWDYRRENYVQLERIVRELFGIEELTTQEIAAQLSAEEHWAQEPILAILTACDNRLYGDRELTEVEHDSICAAFATVLAEYTAHLPVEPRVTIAHRLSALWHSDRFRAPLRRLRRTRVVVFAGSKLSPASRWLGRRKSVVWLRARARNMRALLSPVARLARFCLGWLVRHPLRRAAVIIAWTARFAWRHRPFRAYK